MNDDMRRLGAWMRSPMPTKRLIPSIRILELIRQGAKVYDTVRGPILNTGRHFPNAEERINPRTMAALLRRGLVEIKIIMENGRQRRRYLPKEGSIMSHDSLRHKTQTERIRMAAMENLEIRCKAWNLEHPIGTEVAYHPVIRESAYRLRRTRSEAYVLSGHTAVVFLDGESGCVALDACTVV